MHGLQQFLAFAETAKHGSFAAAARELGQSPSTLAKAVQRLEAALGVRLFHRTTRQVSLTADGERLFERCQRVLAEVEELHSEAAGTRAAPCGRLRVDLPIVYGRRFVLPLLAELAAQHAALQFDVRLQDGYADLIGEGIDLAVRIGDLRDSSLVARRIGSQSLVLCASPAYLAQRGVPRSVDQLASHAVVSFRHPTTGRDRPWQLRTRGQPVELHPAARTQLNDGDGMVAATLLGLGICQLPDYMVERELAAGLLVELLPSCRPATMPISAVVPGGRLLPPPRVRVVLDRLERLRA